MTPKKERLFRPEYAQELLRIAAGDLDSAKVLLVAKKGRLENIGYHAAQCIEKSLKAMLVLLKKPVPLTHDLGSITERVSQYVPFDIQADLTMFTEYVTTRRYEESEMILETDDLEAAIAIASQVLEWVIKNNPQK